MTRLLCRLLPSALLFLSDRRKYWYLVAHAMLAAIADVYVCHTAWADLAGKPQRSEWTISQTLERLASPANSAHEDYALFDQIAKKINRIDPLHRHIEVVLNQGS